MNVYVALCYYKLDYYDVSQEVLAVYLQKVPNSTTALNLKACNHFRLFNGKAAEVKSSCINSVLCSCNDEIFIYLCTISHVQVVKAYLSLILTVIELNFCHQ